MELIDVIHKSLPQIQCGRCDTPGCYQYAQEIASGTSHDRCVPGGKETLSNLNKILKSKILDVDEAYGPTIKNQYVEIREEECIGCKKCIGACPVDAIVGATNLMHSVIEDICTGCELCIEPCPVDCIDIVESTAEKVSLYRSKSQFYFDLKEKIQSSTKRAKLINNTNINKNISDEINNKLLKRNIDKKLSLREMEELIIENDLVKIHDFDKTKLNKFIKDKK